MLKTEKWTYVEPNFLKLGVLIAFVLLVEFVVGYAIYRESSIYVLLDLVIDRGPLGFIMGALGIVSILLLPIFLLFPALWLSWVGYVFRFNDTEIQIHSGAIIKRDSIDDLTERNYPRIGIVIKCLDGQKYVGESFALSIPSEEVKRLILGSRGVP